MSFRCQDILHIPSIKNIRLLGGREGLVQPVRWVYVAEAMENIQVTLDWLSGNELVIVTGSNISQAPLDEIVPFLKKCKKKNISGVVINTGKYIPKVPLEAISLSDQLQLPLFEIPWETHLVEFTKDICTAILHKSVEDEAGYVFLDRLLFGDFHTQSNFTQILSSYGFLFSDFYTVCVAQIRSKSPNQKMSPDITNHLIDLLSLVFENHNIPIFITNRKQQVIFLIKCNASGLPLNRILTYLIETMNQRYPQIEVQLGVGKSYCYRGNDNFSRSYHTALQALKTLRLEPQNPPILHYSQINLYALLFSIPDISVLQEYYDDLFSKLVEYDSVNSSTILMDTLKCYMENNAKSLPTAQALFIHENTLKYRLDKIKSLLDCDIGDLRVRLAFKMGFMVEKILSAQE